MIDVTVLVASVACVGDGKARLSTRLTREKHGNAMESGSN